MILPPPDSPEALADQRTTLSLAHAREMAPDMPEVKP